MTVTIDYNWPTGENTATVSVGSPSILDCAFELDIGAVRKEEPDLIYWAEQGWSVDSQKKEIKFKVRRSDKVVIYQKVRGAKAKVRYTFDIDADWPPTAQGPTLVSVPHYLNHDPGADKNLYCENLLTEYKRLDTEINKILHAQEMKRPAAALGEMVRRAGIGKILKNECHDCLALTPAEWEGIKTTRA